MSRCSGPTWLLDAIQIAAHGVDELGPSDPLVDVRIDELQLRRLKKRKLLLKDEIARLRDKLIPDIIA